MQRCSGHRAHRALRRGRGRRPRTSRVRPRGPAEGRGRAAARGAGVRRAGEAGRGGGRRGLARRGGAGAGLPAVRASRARASRGACHWRRSERACVFLRARLRAPCRGVLGSPGGGELSFPLLVGPAAAPLRNRSAGRGGATPAAMGALQHAAGCRSRRRLLLARAAGCGNCSPRRRRCVLRPEARNLLLAPLVRRVLRLLQSGGAPS
mmetsp:Transcript_89663/g.262133  ORF Transcript_89663/g.262133 Transcript_89663/m.262133 type:complete len:208 (-) Transcript_89663:134-757(-)